MITTSPNNDKDYIKTDSQYQGIIIIIIVRIKIINKEEFYRNNNCDIEVA